MRPACGNKILLVAFIVLATMALLFPFPAFAKRKAPKPVPPVVWEGVEYRAPLDGEHMGHVQAFELPSGRKLWETEVYHVWINPTLEQDVQWVFISGMQLEGGKLLVRNERGKSFRLDLKTGRIEGALRYWLPWFLAATLFSAAAFFVWIRIMNSRRTAISEG